MAEPNQLGKLVVVDDPPVPMTPERWEKIKEGYERLVAAGVLKPITETLEGESKAMTLAVRILYTNHRGETAWRRITPRNLYFGVSRWHPATTPDGAGEQWFLRAYDEDKQAERTFAMKDVARWEPEPCTPDSPSA